MFYAYLKIKVIHNQKKFELKWLYLFLKGNESISFEQKEKNILEIYIIAGDGKLTLQSYPLTVKTEERKDLFKPLQFPIKRLAFLLLVYHYKGHQKAENNASPLTHLQNRKDFKTYIKEKHFTWLIKTYVLTKTAKNDD